MDALDTYCWIRALEKKDPPSLEGAIAMIALFLMAVLLKNLSYMPQPKPREAIQQQAAAPIINPRKFRYITIDTPRGKRKLLVYERIPPVLPKRY